MRKVLLSAAMLFAVVGLTLGLTSLRAGGGDPTPASIPALVSNDHDRDHERLDVVGDSLRNSLLP